MIKILFVCHGNICRSPMAEFVMKDLVKKESAEEKYFITSAATSTEEIGNGVHRGTKRKLAEYGISTEGKFAVRLTAEDYGKYDYIIGMDTYNIRNIMRIIGADPENKVFKLLDFAGGGDIDDPWYTGDFDATYDSVREGCKGLINKISNSI